MHVGFIEPAKVVLHLCTGQVVLGNWGRPDAQQIPVACMKQPTKTAGRQHAAGLEVTACSRGICTFSFTPLQRVNKPGGCRHIRELNAFRTNYYLFHHTAYCMVPRRHTCVALCHILCYAVNQRAAQVHCVCPINISHRGRKQVGGIITNIPMACCTL